MIKETMNENIISINETDSRGRIVTPHNKVILSGVVCSEFQFEYVQRKTLISFYSTKITSQKASGRVDTVPVMISYQLKEKLKEKTIKGKYVKITGKLRSHRRKNENNKLDIYVLISSIEVFDERTEDVDVNSIYLEGYVCKIENYEESRKLDFSILVNRKRECEVRDYFPCVAKGNLLYYTKDLIPGRKIKFLGTFQSRIYPKKNEKGESEKRQAYEIRVGKMIEI